MPTPTLQRGDRVRPADLGTVIDVKDAGERPVLLVWDDEPETIYVYEPDELVRVYE